MTYEIHSLAEQETETQDFSADAGTSTTALAGRDTQAISGQNHAQ